jgi:hypothetical protein
MALTQERPLSAPTANNERRPPDPGGGNRPGPGGGTSPGGGGGGGGGGGSTDAGDRHYSFSTDWIDEVDTTNVPPSGDGRDKVLAANETFVNPDAPVRVANLVAGAFRQASVGVPFSIRSRTVTVPIAGGNETISSTFREVLLEDSLPASDVEALLSEIQDAAEEEARGEQTTDIAGAPVRHSTKALVRLMFDNIKKSGDKPAVLSDDGSRVRRIPFLYVPEETQDGGDGGDGGNGGGGEEDVPDQSGPSGTDFYLPGQAQTQRAPILVEQDGTPNSTVVQWATVLGGVAAAVTLFNMSS